MIGNPNTLNKNFKRFTSDPKILEDHLKAPLSMAEKFGIAIAFIALIVILVVRPGGILGTLR